MLRTIVGCLVFTNLLVAQSPELEKLQAAGRSLLEWSGHVLPCSERLDGAGVALGVQNLLVSVLGSPLKLAEIEKRVGEEIDKQRPAVERVDPRTGNLRTFRPSESFRLLPSAFDLLRVLDPMSMVITLLDNFDKVPELYHVRLMDDALKALACVPAAVRKANRVFVIKSLAAAEPVMMESSRAVGRQGIYGRLLVLKQLFGVDPIWDLTRVQDLLPGVTYLMLASALEGSDELFLSNLIRLTYADMVKRRQTISLEKLRELVAEKAWVTPVGLEVKAWLLAQGR